jgi:hypothetical protein
MATLTPAAYVVKEWRGCVTIECHIRVAERSLGRTASDELRREFARRWHAGADVDELAEFIVNGLYEGAK